MAELVALISRPAEAWGPGRGVMERFQAYLFKTLACLNATRGFGEFTSCSETATPPKMRRSWDHAHAPSVVRYLILTPNRARSASVSGRFVCFDHLWTADGWGLLSWSDRGSVTTCEMHSSFSSQRSKLFGIILLMFHLCDPKTGLGQNADMWKVHIFMCVDQEK